MKEDRTMKKTELYLVGNAHLDPVWQWRWQEGSAEAKATVRSALDRMKEFPEFRFVCSSASVYRWIEEFAPEMFKEVQKRVKEGRFVIVGGWYVQPDCNLPSGEGFARQALYSQRYFREKFGKWATVGYNVDSFGHNAMMPALLRGSGLSSYIFMRPGRHEKEMPFDLFCWASPDGSEVTAYRIADWYCFWFEDMEGLTSRLATVEKEMEATKMPECALFYGVGNHGGGPTVRNLELFREFAADHPEYRLTHSDLSDFFAAAEKSASPLPRYEGDLQHHASGCYSTVPHVKKGIRHAEYELYAAEAFATATHRLLGRSPRNGEFAGAWEDVCFLHFHDSFGGCSMREVHEDARLQYGEALAIAQREENRALQSLSWEIGMTEREWGVPVCVFNPHSFPVTAPVTVNRQCRGVRNAEGERIPFQNVRSSAVECMTRYDTLFMATVPPLGWATYYLEDICRDLSAENERGTVSVTLPAEARTADSIHAVTLENEYYRLRIETYSGRILSLFDKEEDRETLAGKGEALVIDEYYHDTWSHGKNRFEDVLGRFSDATVTVTEEGPLRATVKVVSRYGQSTLTQYYSLVAGEKALSVRASVDWHEAHKMLKIAYPFALTDPRALYEIPFGTVERPADGEEEPGLGFTAVLGKEGGFALVNDGTYSSSVLDGTLMHTVLRSPIYGDHGGPRDEESEYTAQGVTEFSYRIIPFEGVARTVKETRLWNRPLTNIVETWHEGTLPSVGSALEVSAENVILSAFKVAEDGDGLVLRLWETEGRETPVTVSGPALPAPLTYIAPPHAIRTFRLGKDGWEEVLFTEWKDGE